MTKYIILFHKNNRKKKNKQCNVVPIQHSILAQGDIFITSGGSALMFKHKTRATHTVFVCNKGAIFERKKNSINNIKICKYPQNTRTRMNCNMELNKKKAKLLSQCPIQQSSLWSSILKSN